MCQIHRIFSFYVLITRRQLAFTRRLLVYPLRQFICTLCQLIFTLRQLVFTLRLLSIMFYNVFCFQIAEAPGTRSTVTNMSNKIKEQIEKERLAPIIL